MATMDQSSALDQQLARNAALDRSKMPLIGPKGRRQSDIQATASAASFSAQDPLSEVTCVAALI